MWARVQKLEDERVSDQEKLDAFATAIDGLKGNLETGIAAVQTEINELKQQPVGTPLDFTALEAAVMGLTPDVEAVG